MSNISVIDVIWTSFCRRVHTCLLISALYYALDGHVISPLSSIFIYFSICELFQSVYCLPNVCTHQTRDLRQLVIYVPSLFRNVGRLIWMNRQ